MDAPQEPTPPRFTPTERRILERLSDGQPHSVAEMVLVVDELAAVVDLSNHVCRIRKKLAAFHQDIVCRTNGSGRTFAYQHVRLLASANDGRK